MQEHSIAIVLFCFGPNKGQKKEGKKKGRETSPKYTTIQPWLVSLGWGQVNIKASEEESNSASP